VVASGRRLSRPVDRERYEQETGESRRCSGDAHAEVVGASVPLETPLSSLRSPAKSSTAGQGHATHRP